MSEFRMDAGLAQFNALYRETDEVYHRAAKAVGLSDGAFWTLYAVREADGQLNQRELCQRIGMPKQTVNSVLKKLEREDVIALESSEEHRGKRVFLTAKGRALAERTVDSLFAAETRALRALSQPQEYLRLQRRYLEALRDEIAGMRPENNDEGETK